MPDDLSFWQELKRRRVIRIIPVYAAAAFVLLELADIVAEPFGLPEWTVKLVFVLLGIGLVVAIILAWIYDITPDGVVRTGAPEKTVSPTPESRLRTGTWKVATYVSLVVIIGLLVWNILGHKKRVNVWDGLERSIAVLPFENWSHDEKYAHLGHGIPIEIITDLFKVREFRVLPQTSTLQYENTDKNIKTIGAELGANYIITGIIVPQDDSVKIHVQVIRTSTEDHILADEFHGVWKDIFRIQDKIAFRVADKLKAFLTDTEKENIEKRPTENTEAYNLYLKGRHAIIRHTSSGYQEGIRYFQEAIMVDRQYTLAYVWLANCYYQLSRAFNEPPENILPEAKDLLETAIKLDNSNGEAHALLAAIRFVFDWDMVTPEAEFQRALELSPQNVDAFQMYAQYLMWTDRIDEAVAQIQRAIEIDPFNLQANLWLGVIYFYGQRYDESITQFNKVLELKPDFLWAHAYLAHNYSSTGQVEKTLHHADIVSSGTDHLLASSVGGDYARVGELGAARTILDRVLNYSEDQLVDPIMISIIYAGLGDHAKAMEWIRTGYKNRSGLMVYLKVYSKTFLKDLRSDPEFTDVLKKMGFNNE
jgi:TolB-like protein/tetratricopeptide (TPR) repeat protein